MNRFFIVIVLVFASIYILFKPLQIDNNSSEDIAMLEIFNFKSYEFSTLGLSSILNGTKGVKYSDRYVITNPDYTDATAEFLATLDSKTALYKDDILYLDGDVKYKREDGLRYEAPSAIYNTITKEATTKENFEAFMGKNRAIGRDLKYNNAKNTLIAKDIFVTYNIERKK